MPNYLVRILNVIKEQHDAVKFQSWKTENLIKSKP